MLGFYFKIDSLWLFLFFFLLYVSIVLSHVISIYFLHVSRAQSIKMSPQYPVIPFQIIFFFFFFLKPEQNHSKLSERQVRYPPPLNFTRSTMMKMMMKASQLCVQMFSHKLKTLHLTCIYCNGLQTPHQVCRPNTCLESWPRSPCNETPEQTSSF